MKTKKKILVALALVGCAILLVAGSIAGTMAYLTDTKEVKNTFTAGNVTITMDEAKVTEYGVVDGTDRVTENTYKLIPGRTYTKDPTIYVGSTSEECYVFFKIENSLGADATFNINQNEWTQIGDTGVYYYKNVAKAGDTCVAFTKFTVSGDANVADHVTADNNNEGIKVTAYAVQTSDNFANAEAAWNATFGAPSGT